MFKWLFSRRRYELRAHPPATSWLVKPADWSGAYCVTAFWEDLPDYCYDCGTKTVRTLSEPLNIEGEIQYMRVTQHCPKGCGRTEWIA